MTTGYRGTYVIPWAQTTIDGLNDAGVPALRVGSAWEWHGQAVRVDGPDSLLALDAPLGETQLRRRAAHALARRLANVKWLKNRDTADLDEVEVQPQLADSGFVVTNGAQVYQVTLIESGTSGAPLVVFSQGLPPRGQALWVSALGAGLLSGKRTVAAPAQPGLGSGTPVLTPEGFVPVDTLRPGDTVVTPDGDVLPVVWAGWRKAGPARLWAMPHLRPVVLTANGRAAPVRMAQGQHVTWRSEAVQRLFSASRVLVRAGDLADPVAPPPTDRPQAQGYHQILLPHSALVLLAGGLEAESLSPDDLKDEVWHSVSGEAPRAALRIHGGDPDHYGPRVCRRLRGADLAILRHRAA